MRAHWIRGEKSYNLSKFFLKRVEIMNTPGAEPRGIAARTNVAALNKL
jgi:hypothetical protein